MPHVPCIKKSLLVFSLSPCLHAFILKFAVANVLPVTTGKKEEKHEKQTVPEGSNFLTCSLPQAVEEWILCTSDQFPVSSICDFEASLPSIFLQETMMNFQFMACLCFFPALYTKRCSIASLEKIERKMIENIPSPLLREKRGIRGQDREYLVFYGMGSYYLRGRKIWRSHNMDKWVTMLSL